jgi:hypothetical protein
MAACIAGGCATLFAGDTTTIAFQGKAGDPVTVDGVSVGTTPTTIELSSHHEHVIRVGERTCKLTTHLSVGWVVLDVFFFFGLIVDAVTGAWNVADSETCVLHAGPTG